MNDLISASIVELDFGMKLGPRLWGTDLAVGSWHRAT